MPHSFFRQLKIVNAPKVLAIKFKFIGDVVLMLPALRMLRRHWPQAELHLLVAEEVKPLVEHLDWIDRIWTLPRTRGKVRIKDSWPVLKQLRAERFDRTVDFVGNDRGAIISRIIGAKDRLGNLTKGGFFGRKLLYTKALEELEGTRHESVRDAYLLSAWGIPFCPDLLQVQLQADPALASQAAEWLPYNDAIICHLSTSQPKKEWPIARWAEVGKRLTAAGHRVIYSSGPSAREQAYLTELKKDFPQAVAFEKFPSLALFMATLARARVFASPDTAPLHIAAGLGVPTLGLFGPSASSKWAPIGPANRALQGAHCPCSGYLDECSEPHRCIDAITVDAVVTTLEQMEAAAAAPGLDV